jgi:cell division septation protein DedD
MDEPALRDIERWKDKIEVRLDNRQVFFLFFGSALVACMLFVLGVIVGKRLESRGRAEAPEIQDPLAVLDRINAATNAQGAPAPADQALTFPKALIGGGPSAGRGRSPAPHAVAVAAVRPSPAAAPLLSPAPAVAAPPKPIAAAAKPATPPARPATAATPPKPIATAAAKPTAPPAPAAPTAPPAKGKFALQLNTFPEKSDADELAKKFAAQGAYVVAAEVPGKGTVYRVRVGNYASAEEALAAKGTFEKQNNVIAYVAAR